MNNFNEPDLETAFPLAYNGNEPFFFLDLDTISIQQEKDDKTSDAN